MLRSQSSLGVALPHQCCKQEPFCFLVFKIMVMLLSLIIVLTFLQRQTPGSSLHKRPLNLRRNLEENKGRETWKRNKRLVFSEEADSQDSAIPNMELTELCNNDLGCTLMKNNSETEACEESELHPAMATPWPSSGEQSAHQRLSPQVQRSTEGFTQVGNPG